jgi:MFS family permease
MAAKLSRHNSTDGLWKWRGSPHASGSTTWDTLFGTNCGKNYSAETREKARLISRMNPGQSNQTNLPKTQASPTATSAQRTWITPTVAGIIAATFFSDVSHEMATAVLPLYLATVGLGPAALGITEGVADLLFSLSKLAGGVVGHHVQKKRLWASAGYLLTAISTAGMGLTNRLGTLASLRGSAWLGRGFRSPLRDYMLADAVEPTHFGRAYGLERAGDMLGAVVGPLFATLLVWAGLPFSSIIGWTILPGILSAGCMFFLTRDRQGPMTENRLTTEPKQSRLPRTFWIFLVGVSLFGIGDFSRTFLIWLVVKALGGTSSHGSTVSIAVLLYAIHNLVSAAAAYPIGRLGDRTLKIGLLAAGYCVGVGTNIVLAFVGSSLRWLVFVIVLSGVYIATEETLEKAVVAELLPRELRSLGFGVLAFANALGDMTASLYVGFLLQCSQAHRAFTIAAVVGTAGSASLLFLSRRIRRTTPVAH